MGSEPVSCHPRFFGSAQSPIQPQAKPSLSLPTSPWLASRVFFVGFGPGFGARFRIQGVGCPGAVSNCHVRCTTDLGTRSDCPGLSSSASSSSCPLSRGCWGLGVFVGGLQDHVTTVSDSICKPLAILPTCSVCLAFRNPRPYESHESHERSDSDKLGWIRPCLEACLTLMCHLPVLVKAMK